MFCKFVVPRMRPEQHPNGGAPLTRGISLNGVPLVHFWYPYSCIGR